MVKTNVSIALSTSFIKYVIRFLLNSYLTIFLLNSIFNFNFKYHRPGKFRRCLKVRKGIKTSRIFDYIY